MNKVCIGVFARIGLPAARNILKIGSAGSASLNRDDRIPHNKISTRIIGRLYEEPQTQKSENKSKEKLGDHLISYAMGSLLQKLVRQPAEGLKLLLRE